MKNSNSPFSIPHSPFSRYPQYKDSGVDWLGQVPAHWDVCALKRHLSIVGGSTPKSEDESLWDGDILWATPADLGKDTSLFLHSTQRTITERGLASCNTTVVPTGTVILSTRAPIGSLAIAGRPMCTNQGCKSLVSSEGAVGIYIARLLSVCTAELTIRGKGTTFLELSADELGAFRLPFPPLAEQREIAGFLDRETGKIDALVAEQERLLELLKEKRQAVISHAVTRGLNPNAPLKPSGLDWLGDVPAHWEVKKTSYLLSEPPKNGVSPEVSAAGTTPTFSIAAVRGGTVDIRNHLKFAAIELVAAQPYFVRKGDILVLRGNGSKDLVGTAGIVSEEPPEHCIYPDILIRIRPNELILASFLIGCLNSSVLRPQIETAAQTAAGIWKISGEALRSLRLPLPPLSEQRAIVAHLDAATAQFDALTAAVERALALLQERRTALISAAVTGQIDVRSAVA